MLKEILNLVRWAPSGDNMQPWRFEIKSALHFIIHSSDVSDWCVYELDGKACQISLGGLLVTILIAASQSQMKAEFSKKAESSPTNLIFEVRLTLDHNISPSLLLPFIKTRCTQRRSFTRLAHDNPHLRTEIFQSNRILIQELLKQWISKIS